MNLFQRYLKRKAIKKFLVNLNSLLGKRYGKSEFYTKGQVERTVNDENLNKKYLHCGYLFFVDPIIANRVIIQDRSSYNDIENLKAELGELFRAENFDSIIKDVKNEITHTSSLSESVDSSDFSSDADDSSN